MSNGFAITQASTQGMLAAQAVSDELLLESIADGERAAMHVFYARHHIRVYRFILRTVRDPSVAEDLTAQVFLDVWRTAAQFEGRSQVSTWLLSIARFKALSALRQRRFETVDQDEVMDIADSAESAHGLLDRAETSVLLSKCIARLSPAHREIIDLVYYHDKSVEEVGTIVGIPQATVKTRMFYARKQLADMLKGAGYDRMAA